MHAWSEWLGRPLADDVAYERGVLLGVCATGLSEGRVGRLAWGCFWGEVSMQSAALAGLGVYAYM